MEGILNHLKRLDWVLMAAIGLVFAMGLLTLYANTADRSFFYRQAIFGAVGFVIIILGSFFNWRMLRTSPAATLFLYIGGLSILFVLFAVGSKIRGVTSWFKVGGVSLEPAELVKIVLVLVLAKYFSARYIELHRWKNIIVSGLYALAPAALVLIQPDLGSALILSSIWLGLVLVSGIKAKQFLWLLLAVVVASGLLWSYGLKEYQKARVLSFLDPSRDPLGGSYQSTQAIIAIGSGGIWGQGLGQGTQARLGFLPEYHTDFMFATIAEEWGLAGVLILLGGWYIIFARLFKTVLDSPDNFSKLLVTGIIIILTVHFLINIGANLGFLPITGIPLPFVSYGGSNLISLCLGVALVQSVRVSILAHSLDPQKAVWEE